MPKMADVEELPTATCICTLCATVITGLESVAVSECQEKLNCKPSRERGRIYFDIPMDSVQKAKDLHSVENLFVVVKAFTGFGLTRKGKGDDVSGFEKLQTLAEELNWTKALSIWKEFTGYTGPLTNEDLVSQSTPTNTNDSQSNLSTEKVKELLDSGENPNNDTDPSDNAKSSLPRFRVTCTRTGNNHGFSSMEAASKFGGGINDLFQWPVDLSNADIEILLNVVDDRIVVSIALTRGTQGNRNIQHFGPTTLKASLAYCLIKLGDIKPGDVVCDPMCGGGSIPIEALLNWPGNVHLCGDHHDLAPSRTLANLQGIVPKDNKSLPLEIYQWDVCNLPLKTNSIDVMVTDLPFGKKSGSKQNNWILYPKVLTEMARVCPPKTGRAVILTHDKRVLKKALQITQQWWKVKLTLWINMGGLASGVFVLTRTAKC